MKREKQNSSAKLEKMLGVRALPKSVQDTIPFTHVFDNGMIETRPGEFTMCYELPDINFQIATDEIQLEIYKKYMAFLNTFDEDVRWQICMYNHPIAKEKVLSKLSYKPQRDGLNLYRNEMNQVLISNLAQGNSSKEQTKYLVVKLKDTSADNARNRFKQIEFASVGALEKITDSEIKPATLMDRLRVLYSIYHQEEFADEFLNGEELFDFSSLAAQGLKIKDVVGPLDFNFKKPMTSMIGETYARSLVVTRVPNTLTTNFLAELSNIDATTLISIQYEPTNPEQIMRSIRYRYNAMEGEIQDKAPYVPKDLETAYKNAGEMLDDLLTRDQKVFFVTVIITIFANDEKTLDSQANAIRKVGAKHTVPILPMTQRGEFGLNSSLPLAINEVEDELQLQLTTEGASIFIPFTSQEIQQNNALFYGLNSTTKSMILCNRLSGNNGNALVFGKPGTGKSVMVKLEIIGVLLNNPDAQVCVADPQNEYIPLAKALHGVVVDISMHSTTFINPFDLDLSDGEDPVADKADFITSIIELIFSGGRQSLSPVVVGVVDRCVRKIYEPYIEACEERGITYDPSIAPTFNDLYSELNQQKEYESQQLAKIIEPYVIGSYKTFSHRTNVDVKNQRFIVYATLHLGKNMARLGNFICCNEIKNRVLQNSKKNIWTFAYFDEFHLMLKYECTAKTILEFWKVFRKYQGVLCGITQNTGDIIRSETTIDIFNTTSFMIILSVEKIDRDNLQSLLSISDEQLKYITNAGRGRGLLYNNGVILPFENEFPTDTEIYKLISTSHDVEGAQFA